MTARSAFRRCMAALAAALAGLSMTASGAAAAEAVSVRAGLHETFGRIVFDWPAPVAYTTARTDGRLVIRFARPLSPSLGAILDHLGGFVREARIEPDGRTVTLALRRAYDLRSFTNGDDVVIDLLPAKATAKSKVTEGSKVGARAPAAAKPGRGPADGSVRVRTGEHPTFGRIVFEWPSPVGYVVARTPGGVGIAFDRHAAIDDEALRAHLPNPATGVIAEAGAGGLKVTFSTPPLVSFKHYRDGSTVVLDLVRAKPRSRHEVDPADGSPITAAPPKPPPRVASRAIGAPEADNRRGRPKRAGFGPAAAIVTLDVARNGGRLDIGFNWRRPVGAAMWRRGEDLWVVFDRPARLVVSAIESRGAGIVTEVKQYPNERASILRISMPRTVPAVTARTGDTWRLSIGKPAREDADLAPIPFRQARIAGRSRVAFDLPGASGPIWLRDQETGDAVAVITAPEPGRGVAVARRFVDFALLPTEAGLVVRPANDDLSFTVSRRRVVLRGPLGLNVSPVTEAAAAAADKAPPGPFADIASWRLGPDADFFKNEAALTRAILLAPPEKRNAARIALARFYLSHGRPAAAVGVADVLERQDPTFEELISIKAVRGAANYLMGHYKRAHEDLAEEAFQSSGDAAPWIGALNASRGDWRAAHLKFQGADDTIARMPEWLGDRFYLLAYEAALTAGKLEAAEAYARRLAHRAFGPTDRQRRTLLDGFLLKNKGEVRKAIVTWAPLRDSPDRLIRARAAMAIIEAKLELGDIDADQAIEGLERLAVAWRGDSFEFYLLTRLAGLQFERKRFRDGLSRLRQAASYFSNVEAAKTVAETMRRHFRELYLDDGANALPPVRALALFEEFRELTPPGHDGEVMVRKLAERLVGVDLLGRAAELLEHQVSFRLKGAEKARVGARLAAIRLLDGDPDRALKALDDSAAGAAKVDGALKRRRNRLRARALSRLDRHDEAVAAIRGDRTPETERLRVALLTRAGRWKDVEGSARRILAGRKIGKDDREAADTAFLWAIAASMIDDRASLAALAERFGPAMAGTRHAATFSALTGAGMGEVANYEDLVTKTASLALFRKVLDDLKEQITPAAPTEAKAEATAK